MLFAVHLDLKSNTGATLTIGKGEIISMSQKKLNMKTITESELVASDDASSLILRTKIFWKHEYIRSNKTISINIINVPFYYRKTVKRVNIRYFSLTDKVEKVN